MCNGGLKKLATLVVLAPALTLLTACEEDYQDPLMPAGTSRLPHEQVGPDPASSQQDENATLNAEGAAPELLGPVSERINLATPDSEHPISEAATEATPTVSGYHTQMDETSRILLEQAQQQHQQRTTAGAQLRENQSYGDEVPAPHTPNPNVPVMPAEGPEMPAQ